MAANHELLFGDFENAPADFVVAAADGVADARDRRVVGAQLVGVDGDLILPHEAADAGDFGNAGHAGQLVLQVPVLQRPQLAEVVAVGLQRVHEGPADAGRVGRQSRRDARGQASRNEVQVFEHAAARPVHVGAVFEDDVDEREAEEGIAAHDLGVRDRQHLRRQRIGDLILDDLRRLAGVFGVDDHLHVGEVGDGVHGRVEDSEDACRR